jgi:hypothetical protein
VLDTASPQGTASGSKSCVFGGPVGPPPPSKLFVVVPCTNGWSSAQLGTAGQSIWVAGLGVNANGSPWSRHLLTLAAFPKAANLKKALNAQDANAFPQVRFWR